MIKLYLHIKIYLGYVPGRLKYAEAATRRVLEKKVFLEIPKDSQENTFVRVYFLVKKETLAQVFSCESSGISKNTFLQNTSGRLLLNMPNWENQLVLHFEFQCQTLLGLYQNTYIPVDTGRKLNVHKTFRRRPERLLNVLCTFNLRSVSIGILLFCVDLSAKPYRGL